MDDIIKIEKLSEDSGVLIDGVTETVKHETKKQEGGFLDALLAPLVAPVVHPAITTGRRVMRAGRGNYNNMDKSFQFQSILQAISRLISISITSLG